MKQFEQFHGGDRFYSPIPVVEEVQRYEGRLFDRGPRELPGVDLRLDEQLQTLSKIEEAYDELPFPERPQAGARFYLDNKFYPYSDAVFLFGVLQITRPRRVVEIGSGFSSAAFLDVNDRFFDGAIDFTFIDPNPERLDSLMTPTDLKRVEVVRKPVQDVSPDAYADLCGDDVLFIDSSHVLKTGSDLHHILFEILPRLPGGVRVHFHDIYWPFEYRSDAIYRGLASNEVYALRAYLQFNDRFQMFVWNDLLESLYRERIRQSMPLCKRNSGSLWLTVAE